MHHGMAIINMHLYHIVRQALGGGGLARTLDTFVLHGST
jgi:hypothetical protein